MKKLNLLLVIGLTAIIGGSVIGATANFSKNTNETTITKRKQANETQLTPFTLTLNEKTPTQYNSQELEGGFRLLNLKQEYSGYNTALLANLELISQNIIEVVQDLQNGNTTNYPTLQTQPTSNNNILIKYEIRPYRNLYDSHTQQTLITQLHINNVENIQNSYWKITTLTSTQDWSTYMGQTNWNMKGNNNAIIDNIKNPQNAQIYNEQIEIKTLELNTNDYPHLNIETNVEILENRTTYHFIFIEPYLERTEFREVLTNNGYLGYLSTTIPPQINGYLYPQIENYEVIDIPSIMFNILTMPFAFISTAFNLTLFPGTPYQINLSNLFLTIIAIMIFVFIVRIIFKK